MVERDSDRRVALITGASYGVGAECAVALAKVGFRLAVTATAPTNLAASVERLRESGADAMPVALDLRSQESIESCVGDVIGRFGRIDALVNNAAVNLRRKAGEKKRAEGGHGLAPNPNGTRFL